MKNIVIMLLFMPSLYFHAISQPGSMRLYFSFLGDGDTLQNGCNFRIKIAPLNPEADIIKPAIVKNRRYMITFQEPSFLFDDLSISIKEKVGILSMKKRKKMTLVLNLSNLDFYTSYLYLTINKFSEGTYTINAFEILEKRYEGFKCNGCNPKSYMYKSRPDDLKWDITPDSFKQ